MKEKWKVFWIEKGMLCWGERRGKIDNYVRIYQGSSRVVRIHENRLHDTAREAYFEESTRMKKKYEAKFAKLKQSYYDIVNLDNE
jgi:hypothetical protein